jgi:hypothetical protein
MLDSKKTALAAKMVAMAKEYAADPEKGINAGYRPRLKYVKSQEIGSGNLIRSNSDEEAWLQGIAEKDLKPGTWRLISGLGADPDLEIY